MASKHLLRNSTHLDRANSVKCSLIDGTSVIISYWQLAFFNLLFRLIHAGRVSALTAMMVRIGSRQENSFPRILYQVSNSRLLFLYAINIYYSSGLSTAGRLRLWLVLKAASTLFNKSSLICLLFICIAGTLFLQSRSIFDDRYDYIRGHFAFYGL